MSRDKRSHGTGSIRRKPSGRWEASIRLDGQRHYITAPTQKAAQQQLAELQRRHVSGELVEPSRITVQQHLADWLEAVQAKLKPKTLHGYACVVSAYLVPAFGRARLQKLTAAMVAKHLVRWQRERGVNGTTLRYVYRVLSRALVFAVRWGRIGRNPLDAVEAPKSEPFEASVWTADEARRFLGTLRPNRWDAAFAVMLGTGCRLGEVLALRWQAVDFEAGTVNFHRSITHVRGVPVETAPKSASSVRTVAVPGFVLSLLADWRRCQLEERVAHGAAWRGDDRVVTAEGGTVPRHERVRAWFHRRCSEAGVREVRMHDLRHHHASLLLAEGIPLPEVSRRLGHANVGITATVYSHVLRADDRHLAAVVEAAIG